MAKRITEDLRKAITAAAEELDKTFPKKVVYELNDTYKDVIKSWYDSYDAPAYKRRRKHRLNDVFKANANKTKIIYSFSTDDIDYGNGGLTDYVYDLTMKDGWHGGADKGEGHPNEGTPWYWDKINYVWLRPAVKTFSPYEKALEEIHKKERVWQSEMKDAFKDAMKRRL